MRLIVKYKRSFHLFKSMLKFIRHNPRKIIFEKGSLELVGREAARFGRRSLIVCGRTFARKYGFLSKLEKTLSSEGLEVYIFDKVEPNPSLETVESGSKLVKANNIDVIVAFGGGSALDAAKGISLLGVKEGSIRDYLYPYIVEEDTIPLIAIPTTCGTGSEVTKYAVLTDTQLRRKCVLVGPGIVPLVSILDPVVLEVLPPNLTAYTSFDALSHAIEAYLSKLSTPISDLFSVESVKIITNHMIGGYKGSLEDKTWLFYASHLAGLAINIAGTIMVHGLGYYLTTHHNIHHGLANAMLLPYAIEFNTPVAEEKIVNLAEALGVSSGDPLEDARRLINIILKLRKDVGIPLKLSDLGVREDELELMVSIAMKYERNLKNNPRAVSASDVRDIYKKALRGAI